MAFEAPSLKDILGRIAADIESNLPGVDAHLRHRLVRILAAALAGSVYGLYGYVSWVARQILPDQAEEEHLLRWAGIWGLTPNAASAARGVFSGSGTDGVTVPAGTELTRSDGISYVTELDAVIQNSTFSVSITCLEAGEIGNADPGVTLSLSSPITGVVSTGSCADGISGGKDEESLENLRARLIRHIQTPPQGGTQADYLTWVFDAGEPITRAWVFPNHWGWGTVVIYCVDDDASDPRPPQATLDAIAAYVEERRPVSADVSILAPSVKNLDLTIALTPADDAVKSAVEAEIADLLKREASPGGTLLLSHLNEAISTAAGEEDHTLLSPSADIQHDDGEFPVLGTISWQ